MKTDRLSQRASEHESIEATAAAWLAQSDGGLDPDEAGEFLRWRRADPRHESAVVRLETAWRALQQLRDFRPTAVMHPDRDLLAGRPRRQFVVRPGWITGLATAALLTLATVWWFRAAPIAGPTAPTHFVTTAGGYHRSSLADGSVVELNAGTELKVLYLPDERRVHLLRGEAHFNVAPDPGRPFVVEAGHVEVRAVGTAFNVRLAAREVEVLVTEGLVQVRQEATPLATQLAAGEQLIIPARPTDLEPEVLVRVVAPEVMREVLGWQRLRLNFADTALADVITQFNRHNQVQIELADPELANLPVGGSFRPENVEAFVRLLVSDGAIRAERPDANRIVLHPAR